MKAVILITLFLATAVHGAVKYVSGTGSNSDTGESLEHAWAQLDFALENADDGDTIEMVEGVYTDTSIGVNLDANCSGKTLVVQPYNDANVVLDLAGAFRLYLNTCDGADITFNRITLSDSGSAESVIRNGRDVSNNLTFNSCVFGPFDHGPAFFVYWEADAESDTSELVFDDCSITVSPTMFGFYLNDIDTLVIRDCQTFNVMSDDYVIFPDIDTDFNNCVFTGNTVSAPAEVFFRIDACNPISDFIVKNNVVEGCTSFIFNNNNTVRNGIISDNTIEAIRNGSVIYWGASADDSALTEPEEALRGTVITGNHIRSTGWLTSHGIHLGMNTRGCYVAGNYVYNSAWREYAIVSKGLFNTIENNVLIAWCPIYLLCQYNNIQHNTCISIIPGGSGITTSNYYGRDPLGNTVQNNIFYASLGGDFAVDLDEGDSGWFPENYFDYNCYYGGSEGVFRSNGIIYNDIATLRSAWDSFNGPYGDNDKNSLIADPCFIDPLNGDFVLQPDSVCVNSGRPTLGSGFSTMGALQPFAGAESLLPGDLNGDGSVDLLDFSILASNWL